MPPGPGTLWRESIRDDTAERGPLVIDGHVIKPGTQIGVCTYAIHHNEEYFPDPFSFKPERWMADDATARYNQAFVPFSLGPRSCAGKTLAHLEVGLTMAKTLWYFDFEGPAGKPGDIGGGKIGRSGGRGRPDEFQIYDIFASTFEGPNLTFRPRRDAYEELRAVLDGSVSY